ncbi:hypothetical protein [Teredinibacter turnerae]|uniref:Histidine kinase n=1 Tax=Teredinibacter turnerae (strain ATCC 39867 / T7901) TaxID=377629 RepID=C5BI03_TERTT|nr:hypothetical protein [Teredinibacter turnerae]ACR11228.1 putative histidine kinase [Teredinibacter turnerae T7901]
MNLEGRVVLLNREMGLAVVDLGMDRALVVQFDEDAILYQGDLLGRLGYGYRAMQCLNRTKQQPLSLLVLSGAMPMNVAVMVASRSHQFAPKVA